MSYCLACHAEIRFETTDSGTGKRMPLNAAPDPEGTVVLLGHPPARVAHVLTDSELAEVNSDGQRRYRFTPHWKTCTDPNKFRRSRAARRTATSPSR